MWDGLGGGGAGRGGGEGYRVFVGFRMAYTVSFLQAFVLWLEI